MRKIDPELYSEYAEQARANTANRVYPMSIAEGVQAGDIYVNDADDAEAVLFWHYCGFAFITGAPSERFLRQLCEKTCFAQERRMVLITHDEATVQYFQNRGYETGDRIEYSYDGDDASVGAGENACSNPGPVRIVPISRDNIDRISGRIVPHFSWESPEQFLEKSFGFAAFDGDTYCGTAFASGISSEEADIGVEVVPEYRGRGLATGLAREACRESLARGKRPVWDHHATNIASGRTALKCGFTVKRKNTFINVKTG